MEWVLGLFYKNSLSFLTGYLTGCFLTAEVVARVFTGKSVFELGTGNPGMANVMAVVGKKAGFTVLAGDIAKTVLAGLLAWLFSGRKNWDAAVLCSGFGVIFGHNYPFWHRFRGGKGVTVTCSWLTLAFGFPGFLCCIAGGAAVLFTGWLPLGAGVIAGLGILAGLFAQGAQGCLLALLAFAEMLLRHRHGLGRILHGNEALHLKLFHRK